MIRSYRVGSIPTRATINNPLNNKTMIGMIGLFGISILGTLAFALLLGIEVNSKNYYKRSLYLCLTIIYYAMAVIIGILSVADGRYAKNIKCKSFEVRKVQEIRITDTDTISTSHYILYNIKR